MENIELDEVPCQVCLYHVLFWIQVHNLPVRIMNEIVGKHLANFIGEFLEYDIVHVTVEVYVV